jgi:hypothetical protein
MEFGRVSGQEIFFNQIEGRIERYIKENKIFE